jgi:hypothetical protein
MVIDGQENCQTGPVWLCAGIERAKVFHEPKEMGWRYIKLNWHSTCAAESLGSA